MFVQFVRVRLPLLLAAACCSLAAAAPAPAASKERCNPARSRTIAQSPYARVYRESFRDEREGRTIACVRGTGRRFVLDDPDRRDDKVADLDSDFAHTDESQPRIAGTQVVYSLLRFVGAEDFNEALIQLDMATAERRVLATANDDGGDIVAFFPTGSAVVWSQFGDEIWVRDANGSRMLDSGPGIAGSLGVAADRRHAFWTAANGEARSVDLPEGEAAYGRVPSSSRCNPRGSVTLAASRYARVYRTRVAEGVGPSFACWIKNGRRTRLDDPEGALTELISGRATGAAPGGLQPRLEGRFLVYTLFVTEGESELTTLHLLDVSGGKRTGLGGFNLDEERPVTSVLDRAGHVAFTVTDDTGESGEVWHFRDGQKRLVESGPGVAPGSLAIASDRKRFYWSSSNVALGADLR